MEHPYGHAVISYKNSKRTSPPVVGNANPQQLNFQRMSIDKNNAWVQANPPNLSERDVSMFSLP